MMLGSRASGHCGRMTWFAGTGANPNCTVNMVQRAGSGANVSAGAAAE
jgi:hypothetical protein